MVDNHKRLGSIAAVLARRGVSFVAIGGWAVQAQGYELGYESEDIDFTPDLGPRNMERLAESLVELGARATIEGIQTDFCPDAEALTHSTVWNFSCDYGKFDLVFRPAGLISYRRLLLNARRVGVEVDGVQYRVLCAGLADIYRSKLVADRDKDRRVLPILEAQLDDEREAGDADDR